MDDKHDNITPAENTENSTPPVNETPPEDTNVVEENNAPSQAAVPDDETMQDRLERLGGEPAPVITPEEFARLQQAGQVHIDSRGRVKTARRSDAEAGVSLRKRRAWYGS